jgi:hypothetical protein
MRADQWIYRAAVGLSALAAVLVVAYIVLVQDNRAVQREVNQRQQYINQSVQLGRVNEALIRALAAAAASSNDQKLRDLLTQSGVTINPTGEVAPSNVAPADKNTSSEVGKTP